jgi:hypothetical protein
MKDVVDVLNKNGIICKKLEEIKINSKKKIKVFLGLNLKNEYCLVVAIYKKSRFLTKDLEFLEKIIPNINFRYKKKILILNSPICSKAKDKLKEWRIFWF